MTQKNMFLMVAPLTVGIALLGCGGEVDDGVEGSQQALTAENGLSANGLSANGLSVNGLSVNGLSANGLSANGLSANGLSANGLSANGLSVNGLTDPAAQKFMTYLVSCALPAGRSVTFAGDGTSYTFAGEIGLAPNWETGSCDLSCQRWVSACILARVNHLGVHREISMRGDNKALAVVPHEMELYTEAEATYFANLFQSDRSLYACLPRGAKSITRVCGDSLSDCPMAVVGSCPDVCKRTGSFQTYLDCGPQALSRAKTSTDNLYHETISVFLAP